MNIVNTSIVRRIIQLLSGAGFTIATLSSNLVLASPVEEMRRLLEENRSTEAYRLGQKYPNELGNPAFDFFYGIAAINGGRASEGVLALERYVLTQPQDNTARLVLAKGYFLLRDDVRAREELEALKQSSPPSDVLRSINEYLDAITDRQNQRRTTTAFSLLLGGGHDSNVSSGVSNTNISLPIFGDITLTDAALGLADRFREFAIAGQINKPLTPKLGGFVQANLNWRAHDAQTQFDQASMALAVGLNLQHGRNMAQLALNHTVLRLDNIRYRDITAVSADYVWPTDNSAWFSGLQVAKFSFAGANSIRDANYASLQGGYQHRFAGALRPDATLALTYAREKNVNADRNDLSRDMGGVKFSVNIAPLASLMLSLGANTLRSQYLQSDLLFMLRRQDTYTAWETGAVYKWSKHWSIAADWIVSRNESNLALFEYRRRAVSIKLRHSFN